MRTRANLPIAHNRMEEHQENSKAAEIKSKIAALPQKTREFLYSAEMDATLRDISSKHHLHIDQTGVLESETVAAMIGLTKMDDFAENLADELNVDAKKSSQIVHDINEMLFIKIREDMKASAEPKVIPEPPKIPLAAQTPTPMPVQTHEVIMPSSTKPTTLTTPTPTAPSATIPTPLTAAPTPKPAIAPNLGAADSILSEKKVTPPAAAPTPVAAPATPATSPMPQVDPIQPQNYKADPYREPVE